MPPSRIGCPSRPQSPPITQHPTTNTLVRRNMTLLAASLCISPSLAGSAAPRLRCPLASRAAMLISGPHQGSLISRGRGSPGTPAKWESSTPRAGGPLSRPGLPDAAVGPAWAEMSLDATGAGTALCANSISAPACFSVAVITTSPWQTCRPSGFSSRRLLGRRSSASEPIGQGSCVPAACPLDAIGTVV